MLAETPQTVPSHPNDFPTFKFNSWWTTKTHVRPCDVTILQYCSSGIHFLLTVSVNKNRINTVLFTFYVRDDHKFCSEVQVAATMEALSIFEGCHPRHNIFALLSELPTSKIPAVSCDTKNLYQHQALLIKRKTYTRERLQKLLFCALAWK